MPASSTVSRSPTAPRRSCATACSSATTPSRSPPPTRTASSRIRRPATRGRSSSRSTRPRRRRRSTPARPGPPSSPRRPSSSAQTSSKPPSSAASTPIRSPRCESPVVLTGLGVGSHTFRVQATDAAGNLDLSAAERTWTVEAVPPQNTARRHRRGGRHRPGHHHLRDVDAEGTTTVETLADPPVLPAGYLDTRRHVLRHHHHRELQRPRDGLPADRRRGRSGPPAPPRRRGVGRHHPERRRQRGLRPGRDALAVRGRDRHRGGRARHDDRLRPGIDQPERDGDLPLLGRCRRSPPSSARSTAGRRGRRASRRTCSRASTSAPTRSRSAPRQSPASSRPRPPSLPGPSWRRHDDRLRAPLPRRAAPPPTSASPRTTSRPPTSARSTARRSAPASRTYILEGLTVGPHELRVRAVSGAGTLDATPAVHTWTVEGPDTTIDSGPLEPTWAETATFTFSSNEHDRDLRVHARQRHLRLVRVAVRDQRPDPGDPRAARPRDEHRRRRRPDARQLPLDDHRLPRDDAADLPEQPDRRSRTRPSPSAARRPA